MPEIWRHVYSVLRHDFSFCFMRYIVVCIDFGLYRLYTLNKCMMMYLQRFCALSAIYGTCYLRSGSKLAGTQASGYVYLRNMMYNVPAASLTEVGIVVT